MWTNKTIDCPLKPEMTSSQQDYYKSLRDAVLESKVQIGSDLTKWRDAVGTSENAKEPKKEGKKIRFIKSMFF